MKKLLERNEREILRICKIPSFFHRIAKFVQMVRTPLSRNSMEYRLAFTEGNAGGQASPGFAASGEGRVLQQFLLKSCRQSLGSSQTFG